MPIPGEKGFTYTQAEKDSLDLFLAHYGDTKSNRRLWKRRKSRDAPAKPRTRLVAADSPSLDAKIADAEARLDADYDPSRDAAFLRDATRALEAKYKAQREQRLIADFIQREAQQNMFLEGVREAVRPIEYHPAREYVGASFGDGTPTRDAVGLWSDLHAGKSTATFNESIARRRVAQVLEQTLGAVSKERTEAYVDTYHMLLLGDLCDGANIYPTQPYHSEQNILNQIFRVAAPILAEAIRDLKQHFGRVVITTVPGNHGRVSKFHHEEDNADNYLYEAVRLMTQHIPNVEWQMNHHWYRIHRVLNTDVLMVHGHQMKIAYSVPFYSLTRKALGWHSTMPHFDVQVLGHFHQPNRINVNDLDIVMNGAFVGADEFALEVLASQCAPAQTLLFVDEDKGLVGHQIIRLD